MSRSYNDELQFLDKINKNCWRIKKGFVPNMQVRPGGIAAFGVAGRSSAANRRPPPRAGRADPPQGPGLPPPSEDRHSGAVHACFPHVLFLVFEMPKTPRTRPYPSRKAALT